MEVMALPQIVKFIAALLFVLGLMGGLALLMRKFGHGQPLTAPHKRRLKLIETLPLDSRRRLVIFKRDGQEHLVILAPNSETLIESWPESRHDDANNLEKNDKET